MPNAEVWKQLTKIGAKCSNIPIECSSKSCKFDSRSLLARELSNGNFKTVEEGLGDRQDLNGVFLDRDAAQSVGCED